MANYPKISIITPSYNQGHFIEETIISVVGQGYPNLEYIVMDGGSSDNTVDVLKKYDKQITYWQSVEDKGQADAINQGLRKATGDILMWLNSDDLLMPCSLYYMAEQVLKNGDAFYFGNCIHFRATSDLWSQGSDVIAAHKKEDLRKIDYIIQPSSFWTKKVWKEIGELNINQCFTFDWAWFIRVSEKFPLIALAKPLSMYRFHDEHKTGSGGEKRQQEILNLLEKYAPREAKLYRMLINEPEYIKMSLNMKLKVYLIKLIYRLKGQTFSHELVLKLVKKKKYQDYTLEEVLKYRNC